MARMALLVVLTLAALAAACSPQADVPAEERRAQQLNKAIMCPVCPGESIDQSQNALAAQMRAIVKEKLGQGWTDGQIKEFLVERYGPSVLMEPPRRGLSLVAWVVPPAAVLAALLAVYLTLRAMRRSPPSQPRLAGEPAQPSEQELASYARRVQSALDDEAGAG